MLASCFSIYLCIEEKKKGFLFTKTLHLEMRELLTLYVWRNPLKLPGELGFKGFVGVVHLGFPCSPFEELLTMLL